MAAQPLRIMYTPIIIFYVSLIGIVLMLLLKRREAISGHPSLVSRFGSGTDHIFAAFFGIIRRGLSYVNKHTFIALAQWVAFHVLVHVRKIYVEVKHSALNYTHSRKVIDMVRGKGEVKRHGASFYLKRLSNDKK